MYRIFTVSNRLQFTWNKENTYLYHKTSSFYFFAMIFTKCNNPEGVKGFSNKTNTKLSRRWQQVGDSPPPPPLSTMNIFVPFSLEYTDLPYLPLFMFWLVYGIFCVSMITLVLVLRHSNGNHSEQERVGPAQGRLQQNTNGKAEKSG